MKSIKTVLLLSFLLMIFNCTNLESTNTESSATKQVNGGASNEIMLAKFIANTRLREDQNSESPQWSKAAKITKEYKIYTPGIEGASYFEFKIEDASGDAGYILVSATQYDIPIPEMSPTGPTVTELFIESAGTEDLDVIRFDFVRTAAESRSVKMRSGDGKLLASMGFNGQGMVVAEEGARSNGDKDFDWYYDAKHDYKEKVASNQALPMYDADALKAYYQNMNDEQTRGPAPTIKSETKYLRSGFFTGGWRTPQWNQHPLSNGYFVGCGPTAWAIAYAYWKEAKGKSLLFEGVDVWDDIDINYPVEKEAIIKNVMEKLRGYTKTADVIGIDGTKSGLTWPHNMPKAKEYGRKHGYSSTNTAYHTIGGDWTGGMNFAFNNIKNDKPLVLYFAPQEGGLHYGVVEGVSKRYWSNTGLATELGLLVNYGWGGNVRKWIYAFSDTWKNPSLCFDLYSISTM